MNRPVRIRADVFGFPSGGEGPEASIGMTLDAPYGRAALEHFCDSALPVLTSFGEQVIAEGFSASVDTPARRESLSIRDGEELSLVIQSLSRAGEDEASPYPAILWFVPRASLRAERTLGAFRHLRMDQGLLDEVFRAGVVRLSLEARHADLMVPLERARDAIGWLATAAARSGAFIEWNYVDV
jgi:hypothetical protein